MRNYYDEEDYGEESKSPLLLMAKPVKLPKIDWLIAVLLGVFTAVFMAIYAFPGMNPEAWADAAVAAGLRPPSSVFPGVWRAATRVLFKVGGPAGGETMLRLAGIACAAASAAVSYMLFRVVMLMVVRGRLRFARRRNFVQQTSAALATIFFVCSDPVWRMGQTFCPSGLMCLFTLMAAGFFGAFVINGRLTCAYSSMILFGLLCAETPLALILFAICWGGYFVALKHNAVVANMPLLDPVHMAMVKWKLTFLFAVGFVGAVALNCWTFSAMKGLDAAGASAGDVPFMYLTHYWTLLTGSGSILGIVLGTCICVVPFVVGIGMMPNAVDEEHYLPYHVGATYATTAALAFLQLAMLAPLWFWTWSMHAKIHSPYLMSVFMWFAAGTVAIGLVVLGVDALCRDHLRIAEQAFGEDAAESDDAENGLHATNGGRRGGLAVCVIVSLLFLVAVLPGRRMVKARYMMGVLEDYVREVVEECRGVKWIFTAGGFDPRLELEAAKEGRKLIALSMMGGTGPYDQYLRLRGSGDQEDRMALIYGAPMALRTWMRDRPQQMENAAVQLGFELWKRNGKELPPCSGVLARPVGMSEEARLKGVAAAKILADRVLKVYLKGGIDKTVSDKVKDLFLFVQWRLARLARMRAERADRAGQVETALTDVKISDELDQNNESLQTILRDMESARRETLRQITPREGLQLALVRADFGLARRYAETILDGDPEEPNANFAMGMSYFTQGQFVRAEEFLKRCLVRNPNEPAVWNNLAMTLYNQDRLDEALNHARKALELIPESAEVKDTIRQIEKARAERAGAKKPAEAKPAK